MSPARGRERAATSRPRREILEVFQRRDVPNVILNSGQTHVYFASELQPDFDDPTSPVTAVDFVSGSLTADPDPTGIAPLEILRAAEQVVVQSNAPAMKYMNIVNQGYAPVDVTPEETIVISAPSTRSTGTRSPSPSDGFAS